MNDGKFHCSKKKQKRLIFLSLFIFTLLSLLIIQFFNIQILEGDQWSRRALKQHFFVVKEPFIRGSFYSNPHINKPHPTEPHRLVIDVPKFHLYADPKSIPEDLKDEIASQLITKINLFSPDKQNEFKQQLNVSTRSRRLATWLDKEKQCEIMNWWQGYARVNKIPRNAIFFIKDFQRSYPCGKLLGQVLHTIQNQKDEKTHQALPTGGLELYFNHYLKGKIGKRRLMRSPRHALETGEVISYPENGADIYLTIDPYLQTIAEEEIEKGVKKSKALSGWAVMMDPRTGEILALAQYPFFDLTNYQQYFNDPLLIEHTKVKAVTDANEPGSVLKPFTMAFALKANKELAQKNEAPIFSPEEKIPTLSGRFPGRSRPIVDTSTSNFLNMDMGMQKSSNIYMGRIAERMVNRLGNEWFRKQLNLLGLGQKTNIELPAESAGVVPTPGKLHPNGTSEWSIPTPFSLAMGYNLQANTIQIARAYAVLANGGFLVQPTLVRCIIKKNAYNTKQILLDHTSKDYLKQFPRIFDQDIVDRVVRSMRYVTKPGGTAIKGDVPGYTEVGKTSTPKKIIKGQYSETLYCPLFAGFTPAENPAFVLVVTMDEPEYAYIPGVGKNHNGGNCTANVFREIAKRSLEYLGVVPDDPYGYPYGDPRCDINKAEWMTEVKQLKDLYLKWNQPSNLNKQKSK